MKLTMNQKNKLTKKQIQNITAKAAKRIDIQKLRESDELELYPGVEFWKPIAELSNRYCISNLGRIKNSKNKIIKIQRSKNGYSIFTFNVYGEKVTLYIHHLVMQYFGSKQPKGKSQRDHIDGNKDNNMISNLEWVTAGENQKRAYNLGLRRPTNSKKVQQIDVASATIINIFSSITEAALLTGISRSTISRNGTKKYNWELIS